MRQPERRGVQRYARQRDALRIRGPGVQVPAEHRSGRAVPRVEEQRVTERGEMDPMLQQTLETIHETGNSFGEPKRSGPHVYAAPTCQPQSCVSLTPGTPPAPAAAAICGPNWL